MSSTAIPIMPIEKQLIDTNWGSWKEANLSLLRGKGLEGYPLGSILRNGAATFPGLYVTQSTPMNSCTPSTDKWDLCDAMAGAIIYQNIVDPAAHGISASDTSRVMWIALHAKFNRTSEVLKGLAMEKLRAVKLASSRDLPEHLETLIKLRVDANRIGCHVKDTKMIPIILQSLPPVEFGQSIITLQSLTLVHEVTSNLLMYWDIVYKTADGAPTTNALAATIGGGACGNCGVVGHTGPACWALNGGREGQAPKWWKALKGKEPLRRLK